MSHENCCELTNIRVFCLNKSELSKIEFKNLFLDIIINKLTKTIILPSLHIRLC